MLGCDDAPSENNYYIRLMYKYLHVSPRRPLFIGVIWEWSLCSKFRKRKTQANYVLVSGYEHRNSWHLVNIVSAEWAEQCTAYHEWFRWQEIKLMFTYIQQWQIFVPLLGWYVKKGDCFNKRHRILIFVQTKQLGYWSFEPTLTVIVIDSVASVWRGCRWYHYWL